MRERIPRYKPYYNLPYHTILYYTLPYCTTPYHTIPYHTTLYYMIRASFRNSSNRHRTAIHMIYCRVPLLPVFSVTLLSFTFAPLACPELGFVCLWRKSPNAFALFLLYEIAEVWLGGVALHNGLAAQLDFTASSHPLTGVKAGLDDRIKERVRESQWWYWLGSDDPWSAQGSVLKESREMDL